MSEWSDLILVAAAIGGAYFFYRKLEGVGFGGLAPSAAQTLKTISERPNAFEHVYDKEGVLLTENVGTKNTTFNITEDDLENLSAYERALLNSGVASVSDILVSREIGEELKQGKIFSAFATQTSASFDKIIGWFT